MSKKNCSVCDEPIGWLRRTYCDDCGKVICTDHAHRIENPLGMIATLVCPQCWKKRNSSRRRKDKQ